MINKTNLIRFYLFISALIVLDVFLYTFSQMSFSGYWSDRIVFWIWFLITPFIVFGNWKKLWAKIYFWLLLAGSILSAFPMGLPFFAIVLSTTGNGRLNHFNLNNNIRVQTVSYSIMGRPRLQIVKDDLLFDKIMLEDGDEIEKNDSTTLEIRNAKKANLISETKTSIAVKYFFEKDSIQTVHQLKE
ncbi:MAG: hypothetical protein EOP00_00035 [Pedobacter sp.]|nr:MAG: hypothetical protein EOP00_00035 [Pedobacter sp.]